MVYCVRVNVFYPAPFEGWMPSISIYPLTAVILVRTFRSVVNNRK